MTAHTPADDAGERHYPTTPVQCACGWRQTDPDAGSWQDHMSAEARAEADRLRAEVAKWQAESKKYFEKAVTESLRADKAEEAVSQVAALTEKPTVIVGTSSLHLTYDKIRNLVRAADPVSLADVREDGES